MSTGADAKTMPVTEAYATEHERIFGERKIPVERVERRVYVSRCSACDGVSFEPGALLFDCGRCGGKDCYGLVDASIAPPLREENAAISAPILSGRFYESTVAIDGKTDIGSRTKYREYLKQNGLTHESDFSPQFIQGVRDRRDETDRKATRETVERIFYERSNP